eukprot:GHVP01069872.1.p1 GENE.GHVP01069872.1~~GHVP01069872.1.p1  ORF type:complete len:325 (+),score=41.93 GHVP01069872.1:35-1009(+)
MKYSLHIDLISTSRSLAIAIGILSAILVFIWIISVARLDSDRIDLFVAAAGVFYAVISPALVCLDMAQTASGDDLFLRDIKTNFLFFWKIYFWLGFLLSWFILPLILQAAKSGQSSLRSRLKYSLYKNSQFLILNFMFGLLVLIISWRFTSTPSLVVAIANVYGLLVACIFLTYGFVDIPRTAYKKCYPQQRLNELYQAVSQTNNSRKEASYDLEQQDALLNQLERQLPQDHELRQSLEEISHRRKKRSTVRASCSTTLEFPTAKAIETLGKNLISAKEICDQRESRWQNLVKEITQLEFEVLFKNNSKKRIWYIFFIILTSFS